MADLSQLKFGRENAKLIKLKPKLKKFLKELGNKDVPKLYTFSKLSGHDCPYAKLCLSKAMVKGKKRKIVDGPHTQFRCFSASQEVIYPDLYKARKHNTDLIKEAQTVDNIYNLISRSLPDDGNVFRIHVGGDFKTQNEFDAWIRIAKDNPTKLFYAYTKSIPFLVKRMDSIPRNLIITASYGGYKDDLIKKHKLRSAIVVYSKKEAKEKGLKIDHDDSLAANPTKKESFALLIHGIQPSGSKASEAMKKLKGKSGYSK